MEKPLNIDCQSENWDAKIVFTICHGNTKGHGLEYLITVTVTTLITIHIASKVKWSIGISNPRMTNHN